MFYEIKLNVQSMSGAKQWNQELPDLNTIKLPIGGTAGM